jgi:citrate synthase
VNTNKNAVAAAQLTVGGKTLDLPVFEGTRGERSLDISVLRRETGLVTYDPGLVNTGICTSDISFVDGEKGLVLHRGYNIEDLAEHCMFLEVAYLLIMGKLPTLEEQKSFTNLMNEHSMIHEDMQHFFRNYPEHAHPMAVLSAMVVSLSSFYPQLDTESVTERIDNTVTRLLSKIRTLAAFSYKKFIGEPFVYPSYKLRYCENFLNMMFYSPVRDYIIDPLVERALNLFLILHSDHEQNCSTTVVRTVGSSGANLYASISAGICALWGPLHGGANQAVIEMLQNIYENGASVKNVIEDAKRKDSKIRLMGFGHRVYKTYDPRARLAKKACRELLGHLGMRKDPLLELAVELEEAALQDSYFQEKNLYPNVDYYTGIAYRAMGIPTNMFTVVFAIGRLPGWIAQWIENTRDMEQKIMRPRQIYTGSPQKPFVFTKDR